MNDNGFPTETAAKLGGVTRITLDNWYRTGFLTPSKPAPRRGVSKRYTFRDVVAIRVARELLSAGITARALRRVVKYICKAKGLSTAEALASTRLVTDGKDVCEVRGERSISTLWRPGQRLLFVVPLGEFVAELESSARKLIETSLAS